MQWVTTDERLPPKETPVVAFYRGAISILEIRWDYPSFEDTYRPYWYWDNPDNDGQDIDPREVTHWMPLPEPPTASNNVINPTT